MAPSYRQLQQYAILISVVSIIYNGAEGGVSVGLGSESSSRSLVFFGVQSAIEVISAVIVVWRFWKVSPPGEEKAISLGARELRLVLFDFYLPPTNRFRRIEKYASASIGILLVILALGTEITAIVSLVLHQHPDSSNASLIVSVSALVLMVIIWLPKRYLARALDSSVMAGEATCSLSCIQITIILFTGSLIYRLWEGGWWVDSATSIILGFLFLWEGYKIIKWVRDPAFDGGCCKDCRVPGDVEELGECYRDLCECCAEKSECKEAGECKCSDDVAEAAPSACCSPHGPNNEKCCTHEVINGPRPNPVSVFLISAFFFLTPFQD
ncbi:hypothetical protein BDN70DRAFT_811637 [Pholiota conissans]|uniref:Cation efflux protein transmembrane domain-containing protein n=1 Tax=Pholiota conissans TaxID=109636 RepID=A0A9P6CXR4_9AGAR|nr:hypothetical protein BDN70DRAFT_811637 [Pholiota conissans]